MHPPGQAVPILWGIVPAAGGGGAGMGGFCDPEAPAQAPAPGALLQPQAHLN